MNNICLYIGGVGVECQFLAQPVFNMQQTKLFQQRVDVSCLSQVIAVHEREFITPLVHSENDIEAFL